MLLILILFLIPFPLSSYDDEVDKVNQYQRLSLEDLEKIEIGKLKILPKSQEANAVSPKRPRCLCSRHTTFLGPEGYS